MSIRLAVALPLLWVATTGAVGAQGFTPPGGAQAMPTQTAPSPMPEMPPTGPAPTPRRPGFSSQPTPPQPAQGQTRQNYADELTDFGVPPQDQLQSNVGSPTPTSIPGAHVITTAEMRQAVGSDILFVDVLAGPPHQSLPGAVMMPGAGDGGSFDDALQDQLWNALSQATQRNPDRPIAFLCAGSRCWESYNAALRAVQMGFKTVLWYRGGLSSWQAAGLPFGNAGGRTGGAGPAPKPRPGFGGSPG